MAEALAYLSDGATYIATFGDAAVRNTALTDVLAYRVIPSDAPASIASIFDSVPDPPS